MDAKRLEPLPLFRDLSRKEREQIARWADEVDVPAGYHLLEQGRLPHEFFVIETGTVAVDEGRRAHRGPRARRLLRRDRAHGARAAHGIGAASRRPSRAIVMHARDFEAMDAEMPHVAEQIHAAIRARMQR